MTEKPNIELRKAKYLKSLSEETPAYTAQVWIDGEHFCDVSNHGHGGCDEQHAPRGKETGFYQRLVDLEALIKATYPVETVEVAPGRMFDMQPSLETICQTLLFDGLLAKDVQRDLSKKVMFVKPSDGKIYGVKIGNPADRERLIAVVKQTHKVERTLNEMPIEEAVKAYKAAA